jgi:hypothetical protein
MGGIDLENCKEATIENNRIHAVGGTPLTLKSCGGSLVQGNSCFDDQSRAGTSSFSFSYALRVLGNRFDGSLQIDNEWNDSITVADNLVQGDLTISTVGTSGAQVVDNQVTGWLAVLPVTNAAGGGYDPWRDAIDAYRNVMTQSRSRPAVATSRAATRGVASTPSPTSTGAPPFYDKYAVSQAALRAVEKVLGEVIVAAAVPQEKAMDVLVEGNRAENIQVGHLNPALSAPPPGFGSSPNQAPASPHKATVVHVMCNRAYDPYHFSSGLFVVNGYLNGIVAWNTGESLTGLNQSSGTLLNQENLVVVGP